ncbi:hypothetical protein BJ912DRAFT_995838 [Pholiota molesta]|nr:hypothetical protein BJ912DRAFT_995838 [Pholiota molesta]
MAWDPQRIHSRSRYSSELIALFAVSASHVDFIVIGVSLLSGSFTRVDRFNPGVENLWELPISGGCDHFVFSCLTLILMRVLVVLHRLQVR